MNTQLALFARKIFRHPKMRQLTLQEFFFRSALEEIGINCGRTSVNHKDGTCTHSIVGTVPLVFPESLIRQISEMPISKSKDSCFRGIITEERKWMQKYENVLHSEYGRDPTSKYTFDHEYYRELTTCRFALAPTGDCPWSYRFFEGILCMAIPILGDNELDIFSEKFIFYRDSSHKTYDEEICKINYNNLLEHHTLHGLGF